MMLDKRSSLVLSAALFTAGIAAPSTALADELTVEPVASYNPAALQTPESLDTDWAGNVYVSLALTGQISKIDPWGNEEIIAQLPIAAPLEECHGFVAGQTALTHTPWGLYVNVNSCDEEARGIYWVSKWSGATWLVANTPTDSFINGITYREGYLYASDSFSGRVFRTSIFGGGDAEVWVDDPALAPVPNPYNPIGANGIEFYDDELYVANSITGLILAVPIDDDGQAGPSRVHAATPQPCDDFDVDEDGVLYCGSNFFNTVLAIYQDGEVETVLAGGVLDGATSTAFGKGPRSSYLYISNGAFPIYPNNGTPSVVRVDLDDWMG